MGWEIRSGRRYFTRSRKVNGRVVRQYVGGGGFGELVAAADALRRADRRAEAAAFQAETARWEAALIPLLELIHLTDVLTKAALYAAGYRQHARSSWRKKRHVCDQRDVRGADPRSADAAGGPVDRGATG
jgi:hypothetical protein